MASRQNENEEQFAQRLQTCIEGAFVTLCVAMGKETGLFTVLEGFNEAKTSKEIADVAQLKERYVQELLKAMVMCDLVDVDEAGVKFFLPRHRVSALTTNDGPSQTSVMVPTNAGAFFKVLECFKLDGPRGTPYSAYPKMKDVELRFSRSWFRSFLVSKFVDTVPGLRQLLEKGINSVDIGCGNGDAMIELAKAFPNSTFYGVDLNESHIKLAKDHAESFNLTNCRFVVCDAACLPADWNDKFQYVFIFEALHDQAYPDKCLEEVRRILQVDGLFSMIEINCPSSVKGMYDKCERHFMILCSMISLLHCMPVSLYFEGGKGLGALWGREQADKMLSSHGFTDFRVIDVPGYDLMGHYFSKKKA